MARCGALLLSIVLAAAAGASWAAGEPDLFTLHCNGRKLVWQDGERKPVVSDATVTIRIDRAARTLQLEGLVLGGRGELRESQGWFRGFFDWPVTREGQSYARMSVNLNRFTGEVSVASFRELPPGKVERPLLHYVGQCERRARRSADRTPTGASKEGLR